MWFTRISLTLFIFYTSFDSVVTVILRDTPPWDLLIFTQQWPPTVCREWKEHDPSHTCNMPSFVDSWTIHGVWPTKFHTIGPAFCNRTWHFDPEAVRPIEAQLIKYWTNIEGGTAYYSLWAHEWAKHGTCAAILQPLNSEFKYFSKGLEFLSKYGMTGILKEADIIPSNSQEYSLSKINDAVKVKLNIDAAIECRKIDGKSYIAEIRICFDKNLTLTDCDGIVGFRKIEDSNYDSIITNCNLSEGIIYPEDATVVSDFKKYFVQIYNMISWLQWLTF